MLVEGSADTLTLRQGNKPELKTALQSGMLRRGIDLLAGRSGMISTAHTEVDLSQTVSAFRDTLEEMREAGLLT
jgi:glutamate-1-semialdehyde aminotransferase